MYIDIINMPYKTIKVKGKYNCYRVINTQNKKAFSKCSTQKNATRQMRLLRALQFNKKFIPYSKNKTRKNITKKNKK
jgi:hypothetical protein